MIMAAINAHIDSGRHMAVRAKGSLGLRRMVMMRNLIETFCRMTLRADSVVNQSNFS